MKRGAQLTGDATLVCRSHLGAVPLRGKRKNSHVIESLRPALPNKPFWVGSGAAEAAPRLPMRAPAALPRADPSTVS